jgi:hypothetical protein
MTIEFIIENAGDLSREIAYIVNDDGTTESMPKGVYEAKQTAQAEHLNGSDN